ncbi:MAG: GNAT family N-acetyltransferase [Anaerolineae bacterium]|nr:GNAT family N-acetyltransferase [Anaerolineae bacterium]
MDSQPGILIRPIEESDLAEWVRLRLALWPEHSAAEMEEECRQLWGRLEREPVFVAVLPDGRLGGMAEASLHQTAPGCTTSPVGYLEGWYVDPDLRRQGVGRRLVEAAEAWARGQGCREMASDTDANYPISPLAHHRLGYADTDEPMRYKKRL